MAEVHLTLVEKLKLWLFGFVVICDGRNNSQMDVQQNVVRVSTVIHDRHLLGPHDFWYEEQRCREHGCPLDDNVFQKCEECLRGNYG